jgi:hypothetical protein
VAYASPNWERIHFSSMRSLIQNARKKRMKTMNPQLGDGNRHAEETGQNAGVDGVTDPA